MKIDDVMEFEYRAALGAEAMPALAERRRQVEAAIRDGAELEACVSVQSLAAFAQGEAQWQGLRRDVRRTELNAMVRLTADLYPAFRLFLYDLRETYSAPFSVFGQSRAAIYLGPSYLVLNASEHIRMLTRRFEEIIRAATIQPHAAPGHLQALRDAV
jgi:hypothetical protein